mgnify:CR=1 FL=1
MTTKKAPISGSKRIPLSVLLTCVSLYKLAFADALFVENFDYANGELLNVSSSIWAPALSDAANPNLLVTEGALKWDFTNGRTEPVNNGFYAATIDSSGIDSGSLYAHFDITVGTAPTSSSLVVGRIASFWNGAIVSVLIDKVAILPSIGNPKNCLFNTVKEALAKVLFKSLAVWLLISRMRFSDL